MGRKGGEVNRISIDIMDAQRAFISSIGFAVLLPIVEIAAAIAQWDNGLKSTFMALICLLEVVQIFYACALKIVISMNRIEKYERIYTSYFAITIALLMVSAGFDMKTFGSQIFYVFTCMYFVFVPILKERMRLTFITIQTLIMVVMMFTFQLDFRISVDICLMQICTVFVSRYQHESLFRRQKMTSRLKEKTSSSEHDALTGLMNRRGLERRASSIWPYCERNKITVGMIALDIDYFKKYNDTFGHPQGDVCLRLVADALKESARRNTDVVTRTGGEEFLIFVQDTNRDELTKIALKIRKNVEKKGIPHAYCILSKNVTVSIGIASGIPGRKMTFESLYEEADKALYQAKKNGRNCIVYDGNLYGRIRNGIAQVISE